VSLSCALFLYSATTTPRTSPLSLHDALPIFDEGALVDALRDGKLGGAGLDTFAREPLPADSPLWSLPNVVVTPHASNSSPRVRQRTLALFLENLRRFKAGEPLLNRVDFEAGY